MVDNEGQVNALVQEEGQITVIGIANKLDIRCGSAYSITHKHIGYHKICARWVSEQLTYKHKCACMGTHAIFAPICIIISVVVVVVVVVPVLN
jgi:hypothetical protein